MTIEQNQEPKAYDIAVAGGGIAGLLAAARLAPLLADNQKLIILEKDGVLGGRLRQTDPSSKTFSYGLNAISNQLFEFWDQTLKSDPDGEDLTSFSLGQQTSFGMLAGNKINKQQIDLWFTPKGARTLGGLAAARQWADVEHIFKDLSADNDDDDDDQHLSDEQEDGDQKPAATKKDMPFSSFWKSPRKAPAAMVLEHFASVYGVPDLWNASRSALLERAHYYSGQLKIGLWNQAIDALQTLQCFKERVEIVTQCRVIDAKLADGTWNLETEKGSVLANKLVVAQPPWQATAWLPRSCWPSHVLSLASKTKPVSVVVLAETLTREAPEDLPDIVIVPAEKVQIVRNGVREICFQATIDYELSLQAPAVIKAVKALKRARKKLLAVYPDLVTENDHIALHPVAWAQSPLQRDKRYLAKLDKKPFNSNNLVFVGDAYGSSCDGDKNVVHSILQACEALTVEK